MIRLLTQVIGRTVEWGGTFTAVRRGIGRSSPLSPLFGALYLKPLDDGLDREGLHFVRHMDDIPVLAPTGWRLRRAIGGVNRALNEPGLNECPGQSWMGAIDQCIDFPGYRHTRAGLVPAQDTVGHPGFVSKVRPRSASGSAGSAGGVGCVQDCPGTVC